MTAFGNRRSTNATTVIAPSAAGQQKGNDNISQNAAIEGRHERDGQPAPILLVMQPGEAEPVYGGILPEDWGIVLLQCGRDRKIFWHRAGKERIG